MFQSRLYLPVFIVFLMLAVAVGLRPAAAMPNGFADVVVEYFDSGAGSLTCAPGTAHGGTFPPALSAPACVPLTAVLGNDSGYPTTPADFISLPTGSFITLGFLDEVIVDGIGNDIFVQEVGDAQELAEVYISETLSTDPADFVLLGTANGNTVSSFDLGAIGFTGQVRAVKILSLANGGFPAAPGFDLANIEALSFEASPVPAPGGVLLLGLGLLCVGAVHRRRR